MRQSLSVSSTSSPSLAQNPMPSPWLAAFALTAGHFLTDFYGNFLPPLLPFVMERLGLSLTMSGFLVLALSLTSNLLQPAFGYWMDKKNCSAFLLSVVPFGAVSMSLVGVAPSKIVLFVLVACAGLAISLYHPLGLSLIHRVAPQNKLAGFMSYYIAGGNIGYAIAPFLLMAFLAHFPLHTVLALTVPAYLLTCFLARTHLSQISTVTQGERGEKAQPVSLREILKNVRVLQLNLSMALRCWPYVSICSFLPLLSMQAGAGKMLAGALLTDFLLGCAAGGLLGGFIGDRFRHKPVIVTSLFLGIAPTVFYFSLPVGSLSAAVLLFLSGAFISAPQPSSLVMAARLLPQNAGLASGMMMGMAFGLGGVGNLITAWAGEHFGLLNVMPWTAVALFFAGLVALTLPSGKKI